MTTETDLLPCPFCGSPAEIDKGGFGEVFAACSKCWCHMGGAWSTTESDAIAAWNRRAIAAKDAEVEALRAEVERVNSWNARVSVCRDHVADIVDGPCVICVLDAVEAHADRMWAEADRLAKEVIRIQQQYDERTACVSSSTRYERELKEWIERGRTAEEKAAALKWLEDMRAWALRQENSND